MNQQTDCPGFDGETCAVDGCHFVLDGNSLFVELTAAFDSGDVTVTLVPPRQARLRHALHGVTSASG